MTNAVNVSSLGSALIADSSGNLLNGVSSIGSALPGMYIQNNQATTTGYTVINTNASGGAGIALGSAFSGGTYGNIQWNGSAVASGVYAYSNPNVLCIIAGGSNNLQIGAGGAVKLYSGSLNTATLDSTGRFTVTNQPSFRATRTAGNVGPGGTVVFDSVQTNVGSCYSNSTGAFTAPITGNYLFCVLGIGNTGTNGAWVWYINGATTGAATYWYGSGYYANLGTSIVFRLTAGDYVSVVVTGGTFYAAGDQGNPRFSGALLS